MLKEIIWKYVFAQLSKNNLTRKYKHSRNKILPTYQRPSRNKHYSVYLYTDTTLQIKFP